jgi:membrane associated rhomboid family serine protease
MLTLYFFGQAVLQMQGERRFWLVYILGGIAGSLVCKAHLLKNNLCIVELELLYTNKGTALEVVIAGSSRHRLAGAPGRASLRRRGGLCV